MGETLLGLFAEPGVNELLLIILLIFLDALDFNISQMGFCR